MKLDGSAIHYLLTREFREVESEGISSKPLYDYPLLYDVSADMGGHVVLVPDHERPAESEGMKNVLCVCLGEKSMRSAREAGLPVIHVLSDTTFQHLYNRMQAIFVRNERLDAQLRAFVQTHAGFQPLVDACAQEFGFPLLLIDDHYRPICHAPSNQASDEGPVSALADAFEPNSVDLFMASNSYRFIRSTKNVFTMPSASDLLMKNTFSGSRLTGSLVVQHRGDVLGARFARFILNYLKPFVDEMYRRVGSYTAAALGSNRVQTAIREALEQGAPGSARLQAALLEAGHGADDKYVVLRVERSFTNEGEEERDYLARRLEMSLKQAYCFEAHDRLFMLVDVQSENRRASGNKLDSQLHLVARDNLVKVGVSRRFSEMERLDAALVQAMASLERGSIVDPTRWYYRFDDYALSWLLARASGSTPPDYVAHPAVRELARYDEGHDSDLLHTLEVFMRCRYNASLAAKELFVARSTLLNRLDRIRELTSVDLDDIDERLYLALSLSMR